jgi:hypothetical protein
MEEALHANDTEKVEALLVEGADPNMKTESGNPILFLTENQEIIKLLLEYGADPQVEDVDGFKMEDYTDDDTIKQLLTLPKKPPLTKFIKYRGTIKSLKKVNKTRRRHCQVEKS